MNGPAFCCEVFLNIPALRSANSTSVGPVLSQKLLPPGQFSLGGVCLGFPGAFRPLKLEAKTNTWKLRPVLEGSKSMEAGLS
jgi:hypothetical protein